MNTIKLLIPELRKAKGVTQSQLAEYLGISFQSVSKWENGNSMPDITLLPRLAEYFQVSVDELLGLKPLQNREYISRGTNGREYWNGKLGYLKNTRHEFWNEDYLEFLVKMVWKITEPVDIIDFGCGYGYLGTVLLPILPKGSTYTGMDFSETLLDEASSLFKGCESKTEFINCDLNFFSAKEKYDIAICEALLRHLPNPKDILKKMIDSVKAGGLVISIEVNREFENAGLFIKGMDYDANRTDAALHKLWETELAQEGRDHLIGMKIPFYMQEFGLKDIDVRLNDRVNFINPYGAQEEYREAFDSLTAANGWDKPKTEAEIENVISLFMNRGLGRSEAECYVKSQTEIEEYLMKNRDNAFILKALGLVISCGRK